MAFSIFSRGFSCSNRERILNSCGIFQAAAFLGVGLSVYYFRGDPVDTSVEALK